MLPGFMGSMIMGQGLKALLVANLYRGEATNIALPTAAEGAAVGDLCAMVVMRNSANALQSGWTNINNNTTGTFIMRTVWKKLASGDIGGSYAVGGSAAAAIFVVRPSDPGATFTATSFGINGSNSKPASITGNVSGKITPLLMIGCMRSEPGPPPWRVCSPTFSVEGTWNNSVGGYRAGASLYTESALSQVVEMADNGNTNQITLACLEISLP